MEHFNEGIESSELQTSSDVSVDTEPADEALEQDTQELESPPETQNEFPEVEVSEESDDDDDPEESFEEQPLEYESEDAFAQEPETDEVSFEQESADNADDVDEEALAFEDPESEEIESEDLEGELPEAETSVPEDLDETELEFAEPESEDPEDETPEAEEESLETEEPEIEETEPEDLDGEDLETVDTEPETPEDEELEYVDLGPETESSDDEELEIVDLDPETEPSDDEELEIVDLDPETETPENEELEIVDLDPETETPENEELEIVETESENLDGEDPETVDTESESPEEADPEHIGTNSESDDDDSDAVLRHDLVLRQQKPDKPDHDDPDRRRPDEPHKDQYVYSEPEKSDGTLPDLNETESENRTGVFPGHNKFRPIDTTERHTNENPEPETTSLEDLDSQALSFDDPYSGYGELDDGPRLRNTLNPQKAENTDNQPAIENRGGRYGVREGLAGVEHKPIEPATVERSEQQIISSISGGDMTEGSCSSLALAYAGNKAGYVVHDFRDGQSREFFSSRSSIEQIANMDGVESLSLRGTEDTACAQQLMSTMQPGKEYYMATGEHASVVRLNDEGRYEYLELQNGTPSENGWHPLTLNTLYDRFGCEDGQSRACSNYLIDLDSLQSNPEFLDLLGYLNTDESAQMKGSSGYVR